MRYNNITRGAFLKCPHRLIAEVDIDGRRNVEVWFLPCHVEPDRLEITGKYEG